MLCVSVTLWKFGRYLWHFQFSTCTRFRSWVHIHLHLFCHCFFRCCCCCCIIEKFYVTQISLRRILENGTKHQVSNPQQTFLSFFLHYESNYIRFFPFLSFFKLLSKMFTHFLFVANISLLNDNCASLMPTLALCCLTLSV